MYVHWRVVCSYARVHVSVGAAEVAVLLIMSSVCTNKKRQAILRNPIHTPTDAHIRLLLLECRHLSALGVHLLGVLLGVVTLAQRTAV